MALEELMETYICSILGGTGLIENFHHHSALWEQWRELMLCLERKMVTRLVEKKVLLRNSTNNMPFDMWQGGGEMAQLVKARGR